MIEVKILYSPVNQDELNEYLSNGWKIIIESSKWTWVSRPKD